MSHQLTTYIVSYQVTVAAHNPDEAEELAYELLDPSYGADDVQEDYDADPIECPDCVDEEEDE